MKRSILCIAFLATITLHAQIGDPELSERDWYLTEVNIGGEDVEVPFNDEIQQVPMNFEESSPHFSTTTCNTLEGNLNRPLNGEDEFIFPEGLGQTLVDCSLQENFDFESIYFDFFYENIDETFLYSLSVVDNPPDAFYYLEFRVPNGDYIVYSDTPRLSVEDQASNKFFALPNPVDDQLLIKSPQTVDIGIAIYNVSGKKVFEEISKSNSQINLSTLKAGMYLVKIETTDGEIQTLKLLKN